MAKKPAMSKEERESYYKSQVPTALQVPDRTNTRKMSIAQLEKLLSECAAEIYLRGGQRLTPMPPFVLVRVIPKELTTAGGIIIPDQRQNKPAAEGIVLETYAPYDEEVVLKKTNFEGDIIEEYIGKIHRECPVKVGQRVIFPYYEGVEHKILGDDYKLIRQSADQIKFPYCQILGTLDYEGDIILQATICEMMRQFKSATTSGRPISVGGNPDEVAK